MSQLEALLQLQIRAAKLPEPEPQYPFAKPRRYKADFCWTAPYMLIVEVDGGTWMPGGGGRHNRGKGFASDCVKLNLATLRGYRVLRFTGAMVKSGEALTTIAQALKQRKAA